MSRSKKRTFQEFESETTTSEPLKKKQKLENNACNITSTHFLNNFDHEQFQTIFQTIDNSSLIKALNITYFINKEIAEYATGRFVECSNTKCPNDISILFQDKQIYKNDHSNSGKLGYKWCNISHQYFCAECMDKTMVCDCGCCNHLQLVNFDKCGFCKSIMCNCQCGCACRPKHCDTCDFKYCGTCFFPTKCVSCGKQFCLRCAERNGKRTLCCREGCRYHIGYYCNFHLGESQNKFCFTHVPDIFEPQPMVSYDEALDILLNNNCCFGLFDQRIKRWRTAVFVAKWEKTKRIMVRFTTSETSFESGFVTITGFETRYLTIKNFPVDCIINDTRQFTVKESDLRNISSVPKEKIDLWVNKRKKNI